MVSLATTASGSRRRPVVNDRRAGKSASTVDRTDPFGERVLVAGQVLDHPGEPGHVPDGGVQLGAAGADGVHPHRVVRVEVAGQAGDPPGDLPHRRRRRARRQLRECGRVQAAQRSQVPGQGVVAAGVSPAR